MAKSCMIRGQYKVLLYYLFTVQYVVQFLSKYRPPNKNQPQITPKPKGICGQSITEDLANKAKSYSYCISGL